MKVFFVLLVAAFLIHENSAHPHRSGSRRIAPISPILPIQRRFTSNPALLRQLASCRENGRLPCFGGYTLRCYPIEEWCNGAAYCLYGDDELNCQNSGSSAGVRTFTVRITTTNQGGQTNTVVSTTTTTTTSTMTSASTTSTITSTESSTSTTSLTPTPHTPYSVATTSTSSYIVNLITTLSPVAAGFLPGPGNVCVDYASAGAAVNPVPANIHSINGANFVMANSLEAVAVCTSATVNA